MAHPIGSPEALQPRQAPPFRPSPWKRYVPRVIKIAYLHFAILTVQLQSFFKSLCNRVKTLFHTPPNAERRPGPPPSLAAHRRNLGTDAAALRAAHSSRVAPSQRPRRSAPKQAPVANPTAAAKCAAQLQDYRAIHLERETRVQRAAMKCTLCMEQFRGDEVTYGCDHEYHPECLERWIHPADAQPDSTSPVRGCPSLCSASIIARIRFDLAASGNLGAAWIDAAKAGQIGLLEEFSRREDFAQISKEDLGTAWVASVKATESLAEKATVLSLLGRSECRFQEIEPTVLNEAWEYVIALLDHTPILSDGAAICWVAEFIELFPILIASRPEALSFTNSKKIFGHVSWLAGSRFLGAKRIFSEHIMREAPKLLDLFSAALPRIPMIQGEFSQEWFLWTVRPEEIVLLRRLLSDGNITRRIDPSSLQKVWKIVPLLGNTRIITNFIEEFREKLGDMPYEPFATFLDRGLTGYSARNEDEEWLAFLDSFRDSYSKYSEEQLTCLLKRVDYEKTRCFELFEPFATDLARLIEFKKTGRQ